jgi:hypothetical protein
MLRHTRHRLRDLSPPPVTELEHLEELRKKSYAPGFLRPDTRAHDSVGVSLRGH